MRTARRKNPQDHKALSRQTDDLLKQAMQQPGIQKLMAVYEDWKKVDNIAKPFRQAMGVKRVISASNSSGPTVRRID